MSCEHRCGQCQRCVHRRGRRGGRDRFRHPAPGGGVLAGRASRRGRCTARGGRPSGSLPRSCSIVAPEHRVGRALAALAPRPGSDGRRSRCPRRATRFWGRLEDAVELRRSWRWSSSRWCSSPAPTGYAPGRTPRRRLFWLLRVVRRSSSARSSWRRPRSTPRAEAAVVTLGMWSLAGLVTRLTIATELRPVDEPFLDVAAVALDPGDRCGRGGGGAPRRCPRRHPRSRPRRCLRRRGRHGTGLAGGGLVAAVLARPPLRHRNPDSRRRRVDHRRPAPPHRPARAARQGRRDGVGLQRPPEVALVLGEDAPERRHPAGSSTRCWSPATGSARCCSREPTRRASSRVRRAWSSSCCRPSRSSAGRSRSPSRRARPPGRRPRAGRRAGSHPARPARGLGPVLAGMSMRVQAELRRSPTPLLESLAPELAEARGDLRRIVSGLTPSALHDDDLDGALERLVATFDGDGRQVGLEVAVERADAPDVTVAVYRSVAEGDHQRAAPRRRESCRRPGRRRRAASVVVDVGDDGVGGPIAPGVGLTSLRQRAEQLGGSLAVGPCDGRGTLLHVELPTAATRMTRVMLVDDHPIVLVRPVGARRVGRRPRARRGGPDRGRGPRRHHGAGRRRRRPGAARRRRHRAGCGAEAHAGRRCASSC